MGYVNGPMEDWRCSQLEEREPRPIVLCFRCCLGNCRLGSAKQVQRELCLWRNDELPPDYSTNNHAAWLVALRLVEFDIETRAPLANRLWHRDRLIGGGMDTESFAKFSVQQYLCHLVGRNMASILFAPLRRIGCWVLQIERGFFRSRGLHRQLLVLGSHSVLAIRGNPEQKRASLV